MHRLEAVQALAKLVTDQDLFVCAHGGLRNDWWNNRPGGIFLLRILPYRNQGNKAGVVVTLSVPVARRGVVGDGLCGSRTRRQGGTPVLSYQPNQSRPEPGGCAAL